MQRYMQGVEEYARQLATAAENRTWQVPVHAVTVIVCYAAAVTLLTLPGTLCFGLVLWPFAGFILSGFVNAAHDCIHQTHLRSKHANRAMGVAWCTPLLINYTLYKYHHLTHHRHTGVDGDTESHDVFTTATSYLVAISGFKGFLRSFTTMAKVWRSRFPWYIHTELRRSEAKHDNAAIACWLAAVGTLTYLFPKALFVVYWIPLLFCASAIVFFSLPEHYGLTGVADLSRNTRCVRSNHLVRFFQWNGNYHAEHHFFPYIPASKLHELYTRMPMLQLPQDERSYVRFHFRLFKALLRNSFHQPSA